MSTASCRDHRVRHGHRGRCHDPSAALPRDALRDRPTLDAGRRADRLARRLHLVHPNPVRHANIHRARPNSGHRANTTRGRSTAAHHARHRLHDSRNPDHHASTTHDRSTADHHARRPDGLRCVEPRSDRRRDLRPFALRPSRRWTGRDRHACRESHHPRPLHCGEARRRRRAVHRRGVRGRASRCCRLMAYRSRHLLFGSALCC